MATVINLTHGSQSSSIVKLTQADSPYTLALTQCPAFITNEGASGGVTVNLPTGAVGGEVVEAVCLAAQDIILVPGAGNRITGSDGSTFGDYADNKGAIGDAIGESIKLICNGPDGSSKLEWIVKTHSNGSPAAGAFFNEEQA
jgi:hypothetical protein